MNKRPYYVLLHSIFHKFKSPAKPTFLLGSSYVSLIIPLNFNVGVFQLNYNKYKIANMY